MTDRTSSSIYIAADAGAVLDVIADFESYPEWAEQVKTATVLSEDGDGWADQVEYVLDAGAIKDTYVLEYDWDQIAEDGSGSVSWKLVRAGVLKALDGAYTLTPDGRARRSTTPWPWTSRPDDRHAQAQGREAHRRHGAQGAEEARRVRRLSPATSSPRRPVTSSPRIVLVTGKGGVGKTTTAAALAVESARAGRRTLVMSTDVAHSLGDALEIDLRTSPTLGRTLEVEQRLHAQAVGSRTSVAADWGTMRDYLLTVLASFGVDPVVAEELTALPGADEISALLTLGHHATSGVRPRRRRLRPDGRDAAAARPARAAGWHLDRLLPTQRRLAHGDAPGRGRGRGLPHAGQRGPRRADDLARAHGRVRSLLTSERASVRHRPHPREPRHRRGAPILTSLSLHGYAVDAVVVNRVIPVDDDPWRSAWNAAQTAGLATIVESFHGTPVLVAPYLAGEPTGPDALADLADRTDALDGELLVEAHGWRLLTGPTFDPPGQVYRFGWGTSSTPDPRARGARRAVRTHGRGAAKATTTTPTTWTRQAAPLLARASRKWSPQRSGQRRLHAETPRGSTPWATTVAHPPGAVGPGGDGHTESPRAPR